MVLMLDAGGACRTVPFAMAARNMFFSAASSPHTSQVPGVYIHARSVGGMRIVDARHVNGRCTYLRASVHESVVYRLPGRFAFRFIGVRDRFWSNPVRYATMHEHDECTVAGSIQLQYARATVGGWPLPDFTVQAVFASFGVYPRGFPVNGRWLDPPVGNASMGGAHISVCMHEMVHDACT